MAKREYRLRTDLASLMNAIDAGVMKGMSSSFEAGSDYRSGEVHVTVRVYERYSLLGGNRVSLNVTAVEDKSRGEVFLSAIASGGSQAMLWKLNTLGEQSFLGKLDEIVQGFQPWMNL